MERLVWAASWAVVRVASSFWAVAMASSVVLRSRTKRSREDLSAVARAVMLAR